MKILVTGGAGFIGGHLARRLCKSGHAVVVLDNLSGGSLDNVPDTANFRLCDLSGRGCYPPPTYDLDEESVEEVFYAERRPDGSAFDAIYHLAADATEGRSQFHPVSCTMDNYVAHIRLLKEAIKYKVKLFIVGSSMSVYGNQPTPFREDMPTKPEDIYAISKVAMEQSTGVLAEIHDFKYAVVRPHNVYGPNQCMKDPYRNVIAIWMNAILRSRKLFIYGDGEQRRAFSYIDDILPPLEHILSLPLKTGGRQTPVENTFNLGSAHSYRLGHLADLLCEITGTPSTWIEHLPSRPLEVKNAWCTTENSERTLGFRDSTSLLDGLTKMWEWAKAVYPHGVEPKYLANLELPNALTPRTWTDRLY